MISLAGRTGKSGRFQYTGPGTVTDSDGYYTIKIPGETLTTLTFSVNDSGINPIAVSNRGKTILTITYSAKGYQKTLVDRDFIPPGTADPGFMVIDITLEKEPATEAQLPGTDTRDTGRTGAPGDAESILYIIDGEIAEIFSPNILKPSDIKSISILRSPEVINTYGEFYDYNVEGITSVILIETKKAD